MNKPFEQRVINQLERPTSSDLNIAQSQINANHRALQKYLMQAPGGATLGAIGDSFRVTSTGGMGLAIQPGLFTTDVSTGEYLNIGSVTGLNDFYPQRTIFLSAARTLTIPTAPVAPGNNICRRDVIAVRYLQGGEGLTDSANTDIYNPLAVAFYSVNVDKTLTTDLLDAPIEVIDYTQTPTQPIVYIKGQEFAYTGPDSFLTNLAPTTAVPGYVNIAIINVGPNQSSFTAQDIIDHRRHAAPYGNITLTGKATVGWDGTPGGELSNVVIKAPAGIRASIYKLGANAPSGEQTNSYVLAVFGARRVESASISVTPGIPNPDVVGVSGWRIYPVQALTGDIQLNAVTTAASQAYFADPAKSSPTQQIAVNQGAHFFPFTIGTVETLVTTGTTTVTTPVINSAPGEIVIGANPDPLYPGATYNVDNVVNPAPSLYASPVAQSPTIPVMPTYTFGMGYDYPTSANSLTDTINNGEVNVPLGFIAPASWQDTLTGVDGPWTFSLYACSRKLRSWAPATVETEVPAVKAKAILGYYNGITLTEVGSSGDVLLPLGDGLEQLTRVEFSIRRPTTIPAGVQLTVVISFEGLYDGSTYWVKWGNTFAGELSSPYTTTQSPSPTVTVPVPPNTYPAGTYAVGNADPGEVAVTVPTLAVSSSTRFNPKASVFQNDPFFTDDYPTLPITFTVNLSML